MKNNNELAKEALLKKASLGEDIDINDYNQITEENPYIENLSSLNNQDRNRMREAGIEASEEGRTGTFLQMDHSVVHESSHQEGLEIMSIASALEKYDWLTDYFGKLVPVDTDKYTATTHLNPHQGYFIRALPGVKTTFPIQACLFIGKERLSQNVHNVIIAEEGSELNIITGCATASHVKEGLHIGINEFYVKKGAKISFTMIHAWAENIMVRPRTSTIIEEDGVFLSNYICLKPVKSLQMYPTAKLIGKGAMARYNSIIYAHANSNLDVGSRVILSAPNTKAEIIARTIANGGNIITRGHLVGEMPNTKAHLECRGLIIGNGLVHAIPEIEGKVEGIDLSHEAAVGKIAQEEIEYLMARGLSVSEATSTIVRGFMDVSIMGLPDTLTKEIDKAIKSCGEEMM
ncbi:MAG: SufD family Fe-S cluster assembly protein [bacterium]|nr:SufD family Fe-S cluster assembly protein [bacterium]